MAGIGVAGTVVVGIARVHACRIPPAERSRAGTHRQVAKALTKERVGMPGECKTPPDIPAVRKIQQTAGIGENMSWGVCRSY